MEIKERLFHAQYIGIWISPHATKYDIQIAQNLACGLKQLGKRVHIVSRAPSAEKKVCTVVLRGLASKIDQVAYEKDEDDLKLHFTLQSGSIAAENISFDIESQADFTIIVGNSQDQYNYQKLYSYVLEALLNHSEPVFRLLGTMLFKNERAPISNVCELTLTKEDLQTALVQPKHIPQAVDIFRSHFGDNLSYLLFLEKSPAFFQTIFWTAQQELQEKAAGQILSQQKGNWILWETSADQKNTFAQKLLAP
jgi:hypothetical protein